MHGCDGNLMLELLKTYLYESLNDPKGDKNASLETALLDVVY